MATHQPASLAYKRSHFATQLPAAYLYSPSHFWIARQDGGAWRVGLAKFATRMLGDMVDHALEPPPGTEVHSGQIIGWVEGFKAISDVYCIANGIFLGANPALKQRIKLINKDPYAAGWLYEINGSPDTKCMDAQAYWQHLDKTIDKILQKQASEG